MAKGKGSPPKPAAPAGGGGKGSTGGMPPKAGAKSGKC